MTQDLHTRVAAALHIVTGVMLLLVCLVLGAMVGAFGALGTSIGFDRALTEWVGGIGIMVIGLLALLPIAEIVGGVLLLRGNDAGRVLTIVFSVLSLVMLPVGTVIGIYSLWALLREAPRAPGGLARAP